MQVELPLQRIKVLESGTRLFVTLEYPASIILRLDHEKPLEVFWIIPKVYTEENWDPLFLKVAVDPTFMLSLRLMRREHRGIQGFRTLDKPEGSSAFKVGKRRICTVSWDAHAMAGKVAIALPALLPMEDGGRAVDFAIAVDFDDFFDVLELLKRKSDRAASH